MPQPFFSVVIPTRNRAELLKHAIQSILNQTYTDFEIIVSNNFSVDNTKEVVNSYTDPRVRYFEAPRPLEIGESFEFATSHTRGEYITYLSDDDAASVVTLELVADTIEKDEDNKLIVWSLCSYLLDSVDQYGYKAESNSVWISSFNGRVSLKNSREVLKDRFAMSGLLSELPIESDHKKFPGLINAAYHHSLFSDAKKRGINFFHPERFANGKCAVNDLYSLVVTLNLIERYMYVDYPLHLHGAWQNSATNTLDGARKYYKASEEDLLVPFRCYTNKTFGANALLLAAREIGEELDFIKIDRSVFFRAVYSELLDMKKVGVDVSEEINNFFEALEKMPQEFQQSFYLQLPSKLQISKDKLISSAKSVLRPIYQKTGLSAVINETRKNKLSESFLLKGSEAGFGSILEFAGKMDKNWLNEFKTKK